MPTRAPSETSAAVAPKSLAKGLSDWTTGRLVMLAGAAVALLALVIIFATGGLSTDSRGSIRLSDETLSYIQGTDWPMVCEEMIRSASMATSGRGLTGGAAFYAETIGELRGLPKDELEAVFIENCRGLYGQ